MLAIRLAPALATRNKGRGIEQGTQHPPEASMNVHTGIHSTHTHIHIINNIQDFFLKRRKTLSRGKLGPVRGTMARCESWGQGVKTVGGPAPKLQHSE